MGSTIAVVLDCRRSGSGFPIASQVCSLDSLASLRPMEMQARSEQALTDGGGGKGDSLLHPEGGNGILQGKEGGVSRTSPTRASISAGVSSGGRPRRLA